MKKNNKYGILLTPDIKLHRQYFNEMCKLIGINVDYRIPFPGKSYSTYAEIDTCYQVPIKTSCIFEQHPDQKTLNKLGWVAELQQNASIIHVAYDLKDIQQNCLFILPSGIDQAQGRIFRVVELSNIMIYPASISCQVVPEYINTFSPDAHVFSNSDFNLLNDEQPDYIK